MTAPLEPAGNREASRAVTELRAGHATLSAMLMHLFDELDHRRFELVEKSRARECEASARGAEQASDSRESQRQVAALERALASARAQHAQRLAEFAVTRIELAAARIELNQATGHRPGLNASAGAAALGEPDALSAELDVLRSSAVELAGELAACRQESRNMTDDEGLIEEPQAEESRAPAGLDASELSTDEPKRAPSSTAGKPESPAARRSGGRRRNADLERVAKLLDQTEDS